MNFRYFKPVEIKSELCELGRVTVSDDGILMDWSASGVMLKFSGSGFSVKFAPFTEIEEKYVPVYLAVELDGHKSRFAVTSGKETLEIPCEYGEHTLRIFRISEGKVPFYITEFRITSAEGEDEPKILQKPCEKKHRIVFFGDSITAGYGNLGYPDSEFLSAEEDVTKAYSYKTAELLSAEPEIVAISGQGILRDCSGAEGTPISNFYRFQSRTKKTICKFEKQPDIVIINAGTNDFSGKVGFDEFYDGCMAFLRNIRKAYPKAEIIWFYGLMGLDFDGVLKKVEKDITPEIGKFHYLSTRTIYENRPQEVGGVGHPSADGALRAAKELSTYIKSLGILEEHK